MNKGFTPPSKSPIKPLTNLKNILSEKEHGFTLIELIVVIIIVGILAAVGMSQYSRTVEKGRSVELRVGFGHMRKLAYGYYMENGSLTGMVAADVGVGPNQDSLPDSCRSSHYYYYWIQNVSSSMVQFAATRCTANGKSPQGASACSCNMWVCPFNEPGCSRVDQWANQCPYCPAPMM